MCDPVFGDAFDPRLCNDDTPVANITYMQGMYIQGMGSLP